MIYGFHPIAEALDEGKELDRLFIRRDLRSPEVSQLVNLARERNIPVLFVPEEKLNRLTKKNHQGMVGFLSTIEYALLEQLIPLIYESGKVPLLLLLDGLTDVRNFGAIARTAECAGVDAVVIPERNSVSVTADAIKTSSGALMRLPVCRVASIPDTIKLLQLNGYRVFTASEKAEVAYTEEEYLSPTAIVMGSEDKGASLESLRLSDGLIKIPQVGSIGSLNVSVAASIIVYEVFRQRNIHK